LSGDGAV